MGLKVRFYKKPRLKDPYMVGGLPGIAYVAKLAADYLVRELKAELFGEIYSYSFPPYVLIGRDGVVELMRNELYFWVNRGGGSDLIIFTGNAQAVSPEGQYEVADGVLDLAEEFKVRRLFTMAAYVVNRFVEKPKVYGAATEAELVDELGRYGVLPMGDGSITGINGLLLGLAKARGVKSLCLLSETMTYVTPSGRMITDPRASRAVLEALTRILGIEIDMAGLESQVKYTEEFIRKLEEMERKALEEMRKAKPEYIHYFR